MVALFTVRFCFAVRLSVARSPQQRFVQRSYPPPEEIATPANAELLIDDIMNPQQVDPQRQVCRLA